MITTTLFAKKHHHTAAGPSKPFQLFPLHRISARTIVLSILLGFAAVCPAMLLASLFPFSWLAGNQSAAAAASPLDALTHVLFGPLLEEVVYRGLLLQLARRYMPTWLAVVLSSGVFAATHFPGGWGLVVPAFAMGLILGWLVVRSRSLYTSFLCHMTFNLTAGFAVAPIFALAQKYAGVSQGWKIALTAAFPAWWIVLTISLAAASAVLLAREFSRRKQNDRV